MTLLVASAVSASARAQLAPKSKPLAPFVAVEFHDIQRMNLSPLALTIWSYVAAESRVTETRGFGLSAAPHFGGAKISTVKRLAIWGAVGAAAGGLGASAPTFQNLNLPPYPVLTIALGAAGGMIGGELLWRLLRPDLPVYLTERRSITFELTAVSVRLERLTNPIALPDVTYAWVPALIGTW